MIRSAKTLLEILARTDEYIRLLHSLQGGEGPCLAFGMHEMHKAHLVAALAMAGNPVLLLTHNEASAMHLKDDLNAVSEVVYFPAREIQLFAVAAQSTELRSARISALLSMDQPHVVVASVEALIQRLAPPDTLRKGILKLEDGGVYPPEQIVEKLLGMGYERSEMTEGQGQFSLRGGILDVFPITDELPLRFEFFDDEVDSIRRFDPITQRSTDKVKSIQITPASEVLLTPEAIEKGKNEFRFALKKAGSGYVSSLESKLSFLESGRPFEGAENFLPTFYSQEATLLDYMPKGTVLVIDEPTLLFEAHEAEYNRFALDITAMLERGEGLKSQEKLILRPERLLKLLNTPKTLLLQSLARTWGGIGTKQVFRFETRQANLYTSGLKQFAADISSARSKGFATLVFSESRAERLEDELTSLGVSVGNTEALERMPIQGETLIIKENLPRGFEYPDQRISVYTEAELFGKAKQSLKPHRNPAKIAFTDLNVGDVVVHEVHGIGKFIGIEPRTFDGKTKDYLLLQYLGGDKLYIPTDQLDRIQKYIGAGETSLPKLSKLGGAEWNKSVSRTRESVKKLAFDLVELYAERHQKNGYRFAPDTVWQQQLEDKFPYEETPDQLQCIEEIKRDMESLRMMDRLLCGDVGYGKTEVAVRAAFKAVMDSKQVALLVPTTILAQQHFHTFTSRYDGFPVRVELLSRFKTYAQQREIVRRLREGLIDVVIGTQRLLAEDVIFKDLGLLIIDEEQRLGVGHKEKIKNMKRNVDVLTLSATPIPRTLHMSMVGIRDMSVIETPPEDRYPVHTYVLEYSDSLARDAVLKETGRGGQVFFVYNQVQQMDGFARYLRQLVPEVRIASAHGQMNERLLERTMMDFMDKKYDVLLCSTIIESGLDMSNVNTIIVYDADHMGLAQLYQLRGRVGRSRRRGYAYLTFRSDKVLSELAQKRLMTIREFTEFGSGFKIAMRDLETRGAGNLLGAEQHGRIAEVGYELYCKLMENAVHEAKGERCKPDVDTTVEISLNAHIPHAYIPSEVQRLEIYKRIAAIRNKEDMRDVQDELLDRFGDIPQPVQSLMDIALIKADCARAQIILLVVTETEARMTFHAEAQLNGGKLLEILKSEPYAQLIPGEAPVLQLRRKDVTNQDFLGCLTAFVHKIFDCIPV